MGDLYAYFLVGPTASGKTDVAQWIAEKHGFDIVSADSMLIYKDMDIGTAKPSTEERARAIYHCVDLVTPDQSFNVWEYYRQTIGILDEVVRHGRRAIVVGGTGLYVKSLTAGLDTVCGEVPERRTFWEERYRKEGIAPLQETLKKLHPGWYAAMGDDVKNWRRLIRALELVECGVQEIPSSWSRPEADPGGTDPAREAGITPVERKDAPLVGLMLPPDQLQQRIDERTVWMFDHGFVQEVRELREKYPQLSQTALQAIGYREVMAYLDGQCSLDQAIEQTSVRTRQLAKKQRTWFRHQTAVEWLDVAIEESVESIALRVMDRWRLHGPTRIAG